MKLPIGGFCSGQAEITHTSCGRRTNWAPRFELASACHNIYAYPLENPRAIGMSKRNKCQTGHINKIECHATPLNIFWQYLFIHFLPSTLHNYCGSERVASSRVAKHKKTGGKLNFYLCAATFFMLLSLFPLRSTTRHIFSLFSFSFFVYLLFWAALFTLLIYVWR